MAAACNAQRSTGGPWRARWPRARLPSEAARVMSSAVDPDGLAGVGEAALVAELGPDADGGQSADPVPAMSAWQPGCPRAMWARAASSWSSSVSRKSIMRKGQVHGLAGDGGQLEASQPGAALIGEQPGAVGQAVVVQHRVDALMPGGALVHQRLAVLGADVSDVGGMVFLRFGGAMLLDSVPLNLRGEWPGTTRIPTRVPPQGAGPARGRAADRRGRPGAGGSLTSRSPPGVATTASTGVLSRA